MTEQEAIKIFEPIVDHEAYTDSFQDACILAIKALEKQIPKKVIVWADGTEHCPNCDANNSGLCFDVCIKCGQKLDWSEEE